MATGTMTTTTPSGCLATADQLIITAGDHHGRLHGITAVHWTQVRACVCTLSRLWNWIFSCEAQLTIGTSIKSEPAGSGPDVLDLWIPPPPPPSTHTHTHRIVVSADGAAASSGDLSEPCFGPAGHAPSSSPPPPAGPAEPWALCLWWDDVTTQWCWWLHLQLRG